MNDSNGTTDIPALAPPLDGRVADQTHTADARAKQKEILQKIFDQIPILIAFVDQDGRIQLVNRHYERTLGWSLEEILREDLDTIAELYPNCQDQVKARRFIEECSEQWVDFKPRVRDGRVLDLTCATVRLSDGTRIGIAQDITERKHAEEALRESEERFRQLAENIREVFWIGPADLSGALYTSPAYESVWGRSPADMMSFPSFLETIHPEDRGRVADLAQNVSKQEFAHEYRIVRPDGSVRWIWDRGFPIRDQTGQVVRYAGIAEDITDRKRAEEVLRESEERFRQLAENIREVFWMSAPDSGRMLYVSPAYETVWGRSSEAQYQDCRFFLQTIHPEDRPRVAAFLGETKEEEFELEYRIVRPDGSVRWIWDRGFPIRDASGHVFRYAGIAEDITGRKEAEEKLKAAGEQLRALDREEERTRIAREMHDELGSALTSLRWDLEELENTAGKSASEPQQARIREKLQAMLKVTDATIHAVRRLASELRPSILDDLGLVDAIESHAQEFQTRTGLALYFQRPSQEVRLNEEQSTAVFRIFQEAITNIVRHANATRADVAMVEQNGEFVLTIRDDGRGIREQDGVNNLSLGCRGMRERARLLGGKVDISGLEGQGTTVRVQIPISPS